jgi:transposase-like protein
VFSYAAWLYCRFPLSLRMVEELLAARGNDLIYETVRSWSVKFGLGIARRIRSTSLTRGEQDHRAIKRRTLPMLGFKNFRRARILVGGIETMHMIAKCR